MDIDRIEKMDKFPKFIEYAKKEILDIGAYLVLFVFILYIITLGMVMTISLALVNLSLYLYMSFKMDKKIFEVFRKKDNIEKDKSK